MENFADQIKSLARRTSKMKESILTEESTKTSVIMPFFQILGYDIFNPEEFIPEFTADVGIKKGEKVDYAIFQNGKPVILIEAKSIHEPLSKHDSQLFRYFGTTSAKFAILTNGANYRFFTDLEEQNKMDSAPFFEFNLLDMKDHQIVELYKFKKDIFNVESINSAASELKYTNEVKQYLKVQWDAPSDELVTTILSAVYAGKKTKQVIERFNGIVKKSLREFVNDMLNEKLQNALANTNSDTSQSIAEAAATTTISAAEPEVVTTQEELEGFITVKVLLKDIISSERLNYRDNLSYFNIIIDNSIRKWICRLHLNSSNWSIVFNDDDSTAVKINAVSDIIDYKERLIAVTQRFIK